MNWLSNKNHPIIIAEAGVNHCGSLQMALEMVDKAAVAGADYVKFQTFKTSYLVTGDAASAEYQKKNGASSSQAEMLQQLELSYSDFITLAERCKAKGIGFLSTPFDNDSIDFVASLHPDFMKVPSGEITNLPYLRKMASTGIPMIISTGMSTFEIIKEALDVFFSFGYTREKIILLHCNTQYPTPLEDVNLNAMTAMENHFGIRCGYSDHTEGLLVSLAATALGAAVIEKHFTLDPDLEGPDQKTSLSPMMLNKMVYGIKKVALALGSDEKFISRSEKENLNAARKSIVAARHIAKGEVFSELNITTKRPGTGLSPMLWDSVIGKRANRDYNPDDFIEMPAY